MTFSLYYFCDSKWCECVFCRFLEVPNIFPVLQHSKLDWEYETVPSDRYCLAMGGVCMWPRGRVLGGSSVLNAMMYVRGNRNDFGIQINYSPSTI